MADEQDEAVARIDAGALVFYDERFALPDQRGGMARMRLAKLAERTDITELEERAATYDLLESCLAPEDWERFEKHAMKTRATDDDLLEVMTVVMLELSARPTSRPSASSRGPRTDEPSSTSTPVERAIGRLGGRPDLQNVIDMGQKRQAS